jgi:uncharacterized membrane protein YphA (DoxX/SURF4 family)
VIRPRRKPASLATFHGGTLFRTFSTFPDGWPGAGLLLLRLAIGALLAVQGMAYLADWSALLIPAMLLALLTLTSGVLLIVGCLTLHAALVATIACVCDVFSWLPHLGPDMFGSRLSCVLVAAIAAALICLGPGAFSLDAVIFGRREIVIPK